ncbi:galactose oxidase early set domain-containing protein [Streptomyces sp. NPDC045470]|uniref:galactose oxidase early set domain-containing protein n=1 Tax=Streptomyces sp. NPDC045470 TaxID=3155469 RepID=UPI0033DCCD85
MPYRPSARTRKTVIGAAALLTLAGLNAPAVHGIATRAYHQYAISRPEYLADHGRWETVEVPERWRVNAIHAALLHTGKVLLIAGSGNDEKQFAAGTFRSVLWDPAGNTFAEVPTPKDLFCGGHAQLPGGRLLVAGGTARYEKLEGDVHRAGGTMIVTNEYPDAPKTLPKGTVFRSPAGKTYRSQSAVLVPRARKVTLDGGRRVRVTASRVRVYVEADRPGPEGATHTAARYTIDGLSGADARNHYGTASKLALDKKDFQGIREAYEFDPVAERYVPTAPMAEARWYPSLATLADGTVLAASGLDDMGQIIPGRNEIYRPATRTWSPGPNRYFPTYPALFLTADGKLFYSGSSSGYGPADRGRRPGLWDVRSNTFQPVPGLDEADLTETSASVLLPPAQQQRVMILGGGGVGESPRATGRTAIADLTRPSPHYRRGPDLGRGTRYLNAVLTPDDRVFTTGGSSDYRGKGTSDHLVAQFYDPVHDVFRPAAEPGVGRNYHAEALLLPDGRIATFGSDPLFADEANTQDGSFEQRIEVYSPPYLYRPSRPRVLAGPSRIARGAAATFTLEAAGTVRGARLMRPSVVTHTTDIEQRSIALDIAQHGTRLRVTVPKSPGLVPRGWYMLTVSDARGTPSPARWVQVT